MGLIERIQANRQAEERVIGGVPWRPWDSPYWKFSQGGPIHPTKAFYGTDKAIGLPALYSCVRLIAESIASLPLKIYTRAPGSGSGSGSQTSPVRYTGPSIFDNPSTSANLYDWLYQCMVALLLHGNAWGFITNRDGYGYPTGIDWIPPDMVYVEDDPQQPWNQLRTRVYVYGRRIDNWRDELFHIRAFTLPGKTEGASPLRIHAMTVMSGMEAQQYGNDWFAYGGFPPGTFQNNEIEIDSAAAEDIRASLTASIQRRQPLVYGRDWDYKPVVVPPGEAQFIETMQMNATQLAAVYGLPPDRVGGKRGDSLTYNTVEQSTLQVIEALRPWLVRLETAFFDILPANRYVRFNADALLKTDLKTRTEIYMQQRAMGLLTIDEIRDQEDKAPYPNSVGDEKIPLEVMVAMSRSIRAIPNSMLPSITLEVDLIADRLEKLETDDPGMTAPDTGPALPNVDQFMASQLGSVRSDITDGMDGETIMALRRLLHERQRQEEALKGPQFVGPWIPGKRDAPEPASDDLPDGHSLNPVVQHGPEMYTAHRLDEAAHHLSHATERIRAARGASGDDRAYESDHVLTDLGESHTATKRLMANVRQNYPEESNELDSLGSLTDVRAKSLSKNHKVATFAHLLQTVLYHQGHAIRHAQVMRNEESDPMWNFDADHCAKHTGEALDHVRKLTEHVRENYPQESGWLKQLNNLAGRRLAGSNGNGRH